MHDKIIGPFWFVEKSITAQIYFDILTEYMAPQLNRGGKKNQDIYLSKSFITF